MAKKRVLIVGGGVAGMTTAHELAEKGLDVTILERRTDRCGGKARTEPFLGSARGGRRPLPGEHGFRFFPGFYKHLDDTMRRIPFGNNRHGVFDNLVTCETGLFACLGKAPFPMLVHFPQTVEQLVEAANFIWTAPDAVRSLGLTNADFAFYLGKMLQIATSCDARRFGEYERVGWWHYVDAANRSPEYQLYLATGMTRSAVATKAETANSRTIGTVGLQLMFDMMTPGKSADRVLTGPTTDAWLDAWRTHLGRLGVRYEMGRTVTEIEFDGSRITGLILEGGIRREADDYVIALPVEVTAKLISRKMKDRDPILGHLDELSKQVNWMNGIQFYLQEDITLTRGHINLLDTPWALTALFQQQFWPWLDLRDHGDGTTRSILSVDISAWDVPGLPNGPSMGKFANECTPDEVAEETWFQLCQCLNTDRQRLPDRYQSYWLDDDLQRVGRRRPGTTDLPGVQGGKYVNLEPLLVNLVNAWGLRPEAYTAIPNLYLAGDFVRTNTDFASMEGACESGRRAARSLLMASDLPGQVDVWPLEEPAFFAPLRNWDADRYAQGLPWAPPGRAPVEVGNWLGAVREDLIETVEVLADDLSPSNLLRDGAALVAGILSDGVRDVQRRAEAIIDRAAGRGEVIPGPEVDWLCYQHWTSLGFLHWRVSPELVRPWVPTRLDLDLFEGDAWVSLVPMRMKSLILRIGDPPGADDFPELNFRTYVRRGPLRGVYFFRIHCPDLLAVIGANLIASTAYQMAEVTQVVYEDGRFDFTCDPDGDDHFELTLAPEGEPFVAEEGSIEAFLSGRSASFTISKLGRLLYGQVAHDPWRVQRARVTVGRNAILNGLGVDSLTPDLALFSEGTEAVMWPFTPVE